MRIVCFWITILLMEISTNRLRQWRSDRKLTQGALGKLVDCTAAYICALERGHRTPGRKLACRIERVTHGAVRVSDWDAVA